jgi:hypothetical protein
MQELITANLAYFIKVKLKGNSSFLEIRQMFPIKANHLVNKVVRTANSIFL